ncbi:MAG: hydroxysqualene dehydroxylase HpnE [Pseudomonadota bacterium]
MVAPLNIAVIGGGYAGMAAAVTLAARGIPVTVFENARQLGGRARGVSHHHTQLDNGQHILLGCYRQTLDIIQQVGGNIEQDFLRLPLQLTLHRHFSLHAPRLPAPWHTLLGLLGARGLSWAERINAIRFMLALRRSNFRLVQDLSVQDLLHAHHQSAAAVRYLWQPICISALNTPLHMASAQVLLNVLRDSLNGLRSDSDMLLPRMDFSALFPQRAADYIQQRGGSVLTSCSVEQIVPSGEGIDLSTATGTHRFSHVICAVAPAAAARLLHNILQLMPLAARIAAIAHQPIYTIYLQYPEQVCLPQAMLGLDGGVAQWLFDRGQIGGQHGLIAAVISAEGLHQKMSHEQLAQTVIQELRDCLNIAAAPLWYQTIAEKRATFSCTAGLVRPPQITPLSNIFLAGDYTAGDYPATLEGAVRSGIHCANLIG